MSKVIEVYRVFSAKVGEEEARILAEALEELSVPRENLATKEDLRELEERLTQRIQDLDRKLWWLVGFILLQWITTILTILFKG